MKTYYIKTLGCQMNEHDSQRIAGMLESLDFKPSERLNDFKDVNADIVVINTCAVRQNAATRLYGNLGMLKKSKLKAKKMIIAVGGCLAQLDREAIIKKAPWVDIVFGTNNLQSLPHLIKRVENNEKNAVEIAEHLEVFPSSLPTHIANPYSAYVTISAGCDENCTFCIVPQLRGREQDRDPADIISEIQALIQNGYKEITLLGQNVNSYGKKLRDENGKPYRFANLLQDVAKINGLKRLRYMSPHPASFEDNVIDAMQAHPNIMPSIHLPLQSGSNKVLRDMKRSYKISHYKKIIEKLKNSIPDIEITTDIIVGFPTETDEDFEETLNIIRDVEFLSAYTFIYSPRPGTPAAEMVQLDKNVVQKRFEKLQTLQDEIMLKRHKAYIEKIVKVLVEKHSGRKDDKTKRFTGRDEHGILVHFESFAEPTPGSIVDVKITYSAPTHLLGNLESESNKGKV